MVGSYTLYNLRIICKRVIRNIQWRNVRLYKLNRARLVERPVEKVGRLVEPIRWLLLAFLTL